MPSNRITTTIRLEEADYRVLQQIAAKEVRSVNNLMEFILKNYIKEYREKL